MAEGATNPDETQDLTDGFHLLIDALKLNGFETLYGVPGIPITDFTAWRRRPVFACCLSGTNRTRATPRPSRAF